jgi:hypothetical protein
MLKSGIIEAVELHNKIRVMPPYLAAIASASPICEAKPMYVDSRLYFCRFNRKKNPLIWQRRNSRENNELQGVGVFKGG